MKKQFHIFMFGVEWIVNATLLTVYPSNPENNEYFIRTIEGKAGEKVGDYNPTKIIEEAVRVMNENAAGWMNPEKAEEQRLLELEAAYNDADMPRHAYA